MITVTKLNDEFCSVNLNGESFYVSLSEAEAEKIAAIARHIILMLNKQTGR